jgi:hypothetical protein
MCYCIFLSFLRVVAMTESTPHWDIVHHVSNYYDGPLEGLAEFQGQPHQFFFHEEVRRPRVDTAPQQSSGFAAGIAQAIAGAMAAGNEEGDDDDDDDEAQFDWIYALVPVPAELADRFKEKHAIFERWYQAYSRDATLMKDHPALPEDRAQYETLTALLSPWLEANRTRTDLLRRGQFASGRTPAAPGGSRWTTFQVMWLDPLPA